MIRPHQTLAFLLALGALCTGLMFLVPDDGIKLGPLEVRYPSWESFNSQDTVVKVDMNAILRASHMAKMDSVQQAQEAEKILSEQRRKEEERIQRILAARKLQFVPGSESLGKFQKALENLKGNKKLRILHFGDSQIEGDRISSLLRQRWQEEYGGNGPGMQPAVPLAPSMSIRQSYSPNWKRYPFYGKRDTNIEHSRYGYTAVLSRFTPPQLDSLVADTTEAWLQFERSNAAYNRARSFSHLRMYLGANRMPLQIRMFADDSLIVQDTLPIFDSIRLLKYSLPLSTRKVRIVFQGSSSPDVYGVSLEGESGIVLDNIAMRGASGVIFSRLDRNSTSAMLRSEPVGLVLLQYGGNTVPYIKDEKHAQQYAARLARQIRLLKLWLPQASFVLIGPSDMSKKEGTDYVTYDAVPWVRDALKNMSMKEEIGFWDIYGAMGGRNSMPQWVNADPPLAGADHIHFTPKGAKQIAEWLFTAFDEVINPKEEMNEEMKSAEDES